MRIPAPGGPPEQVLEAPPDTTTLFHCPFHTAGTCVLSRWAQGQLVFYLLDPVQGQGKELARTRLGQPGDLGWSVSPDGSRIAIRSEDQLSGQVRILEVRNSSERNLQLPNDWGMWDLAWSANGKVLFLASQSTAGYFIASLGLDGKSRVLLDRGRNQWLGFATPSPDGRRLAFTQQTFELNVWLLEDF